jgi:hypothetical protein
MTIDQKRNDLVFVPELGRLVGKAEDLFAEGPFKIVLEAVTLKQGCGVTC